VLTSKAKNIIARASKIIVMLCIIIATLLLIAPVLLLLYVTSTSNFFFGLIAVIIFFKEIGFFVFISLAIISLLCLYLCKYGENTPAS